MNKHLDFHEFLSFLENYRKASRKLLAVFGNAQKHFREAVDDFSVAKIRLENFEKNRNFDEKIEIFHEFVSF